MNFYFFTYSLMMSRITIFGFCPIVLSGGKQRLLLVSINLNANDVRRPPHACVFSPLCRNNIPFSFETKALTRSGLMTSFSTQPNHTLDVFCSSIPPYPLLHRSQLKTTKPQRSPLEKKKLVPYCEGICRKRPCYRCRPGREIDRCAAAGG